MSQNGCLCNSVAQCSCHHEMLTVCLVLGTHSPFTFWYQHFTTLSNIYMVIVQDVLLDISLVNLHVHRVFQWERRKCIQGKTDCMEKSLCNSKEDWKKLQEGPNSLSFILHSYWLLPTQRSCICPSAYSSCITV